jgi:hypothetical protein
MLYSNLGVKIALAADLCVEGPRYFNRAKVA